MRSLKFSFPGIPAFMRQKSLFIMYVTYAVVFSEHLQRVLQGSLGQLI